MNADITHVALGKQQIGVQMVVHRDLLDNHIDGVFAHATIEEQRDYFYGHLIIKLRSFILKSPQTEKKFFSISVPDTWWDHLKHDWIRGKLWQQMIALRLSPAQYRTETQELDAVTRVCPHNNSYLQEKPEVHFDFLTWKDEHESELPEVPRD